MVKLLGRLEGFIHGMSGKPGSLGKGGWFVRREARNSGRKSFFGFRVNKDFVF